MSDNGEVQSTELLSPERMLEVLRVNSELVDRLSNRRWSTAFGGDRDYYKVLGWDKEPDYDDFELKYDRQDIAERIVEAPVEDTWREPPDLFDGVDDDRRDDTPFVVETRALLNDSNLKAWSAFENVDALSGIGRFGVLLIGLSDAGNMERAPTRPKEVLYLTAYSEADVNVVSVEKDPKNKRFGLPTMYEITTGIDDGPSSAAAKHKVHWQRVIHVASGNRRSKIYGKSRLLGVYNLLDDLLKVVGGSAEATWKLIYKGIILTSKEGYALPTDEDELSELESRIQAYVNDLRRFLTLEGMDVTEMGGQTIDPSGLVKLIISLISAKTRIPVRLLLGSERGELASSQDQSNWAGQIAARRRKFAEPIILQVFINRLLEWGMVPPPKNNAYSFVWSPLFELNALEKADIASKMADAFFKVTGGAPQAIVGAGEFRSEYTTLPAKMELDEMDEINAPPVPPATSTPPDGDNATGSDVPVAETESTDSQDGD